MSTAETIEHVLGPVDQIPVGEGREFHVAGRRLAVFRPRGGGLAVTQAECPHQGGPLADGIIGMDSVVCPLHAWRFCLGTGEAQAGGCAGIDVHPSRISASGDIVVSLTIAETVEATGGAR